ncbi:acyltransferase PGAP2-like isoform X2 [Amblyomma americanum]|uniref:CWH43-like N-terminal domain-containing protein n=2 Tax=Amblyomma americanum TaxID=6943 RepID=A0AAQ4DE70_AMBAM
MAQPVALVRVPFRIFAVVTVLFPFFSFVFCVLWSLMFNFAAVTATHCGVANFLPSISAAIGGHTPQRYIWRSGIALHAAPRLLVSVMYYRYYQGMLDIQHQYVARISWCLNTVEVLCLLGLTNVSSTENYAAHEKMFITFVTCSLLYMMLCCVMPGLGKRRSLSAMEAYSLKVKKRLTIVSIVLSIVCCYFFVRHTKHCEPGMYTLFAAAEYIVVLCNMGFHMTAYWDFADKSFYVSELPRETEEDKEPLLTMNQEV